MGVRNHQTASLGGPPALSVERSFLEEEGENTGLHDILIRELKKAFDDKIERISTQHSV
jgi:hypothetical protein